LPVPEKSSVLRTGLRPLAAIFFGRQPKNRKARLSVHIAYLNREVGPESEGNNNNNKKEEKKLYVNTEPL
jgi:hypothetical protein